MKIHDLLDTHLLDDRISDCYVSFKKHPTLPLGIYNYTKKCQYDGAWDEITRKTRGLIVADTGEIVARPWEKFHNYAEHDTGDWDINEPCLVTDKLDGSLGVLYPTPDGHAVATRGSFVSDQAVRATEIWKERYSGVPVVPEYTYLFEIIFPSNRVVIDYGNQEDLFLLGCVEIRSGRTMEAELVAWPGPRVSRFGHMTLRDALAIEPRQNAEGVVLTLFEREPEMRVKIKQEDYVALHRIITGLTERSVWEHLAVEACASWINDPKHWGSFIGIDPQRASEIITVGPEWRVVIPEEFQEWIDETEERIKTNVVECTNEAERLMRQASALPTPREQYELVRTHPCSAEIMRVIKNAGGVELVWQKAWRVSKPEAANPIFGREEDVA